MVGLVVATHGQLAAELLRTAEGIVGPVPSAAAVSIDSSTSVEEARARLATAIHKVGIDGEGVLVLTDMFGGTPANLALTFLDEQIEVVTGVNLPMLMKLAGTRGNGLAAAAELATTHGQKNITLASALLRARAQSNR
jgi:mannose PTS system EIIA component